MCRLYRLAILFAVTQAATFCVVLLSGPAVAMIAGLVLVASDGRLRRRLAKVVP